MVENAEVENGAGTVFFYMFLFVLYIALEFTI